MATELQPQPNPWNDRLYRVIPDLPFRLRLRWNLLVGLRYVGNLLLCTPQALVYAVFHPRPRIVDDHTFEERFDNTVFNRLIVPCDTDDPNHPYAPVCAPAAHEMATRLFPEQTAAHPGVRFFLADFSIYDGTETYPGTYLAGTTVLFKRDSLGARLVVLAIRHGDVIFEPGDGQAWDLAKLFTLQAGTIRLVYATHAMLHFPEDSINAISMSKLPESHVLHQLLEPHLDLQLALDHKVQTSKSSPLLNDQRYPWSAYTGPVAGSIRALETIYLGVPGNPAYPTYSYKHPRRTPDEKYVNFLEAYYQTILAFVQKVLANVEPGDPVVVAWADEVAANVPGFPNGSEIFAIPDKPGFIRNLDWAVATFIWDVSVGHTADHYNLGLLDINQNPMRIRVPPPTSKTATYDPRALGRWTDSFRYRLFWRMYLRATTILRLDRVCYRFDDPRLRALNREFIAALRETEARLSASEFVPLKAIARSIQF